MWATIPYFVKTKSFSSDFFSPQATSVQPADGQAGIEFEGMFVQLQGGEDHDATFFSPNEEDRLKNPFFLVKLRQVLITYLWKAYSFLKIFVEVTVEHISNTKMFPSYISISNLVILVGVSHNFSSSLSCIHSYPSSWSCSPLRDAFLLPLLSAVSSSQSSR